MARLDGEGYFQGEVRVIHGFLTMSAAIQHLITRVLEKDLQVLLENVPAMIRSQRNPSVGGFKAREFFFAAALDNFVLPQRCQFPSERRDQSPFQDIARAAGIQLLDFSLG
jgi:hypothetical protein